MFQFNSPTCIVGYGTSLPSTVHNREAAMKRIREAYESLSSNDLKNGQYDMKKEVAFYERLTKATKIDTRHICGDVLALEKKYNFQVPYSDKMKLWYDSASQLVTKSVDEAINDYLSNYGGSSVGDITHVICHSVTGWSCPGMTHHIINQFDLSSSVRPIEANIAGCFGGSHLLYLATSILNMNPNAVIVICDTEIMEAPWAFPAINFDRQCVKDRREYICLSIFGSGCAAFILKKIKVTSLVKRYFSNNNSAPLWQVIDGSQYCKVIPNSNDDVTFSWVLNPQNNITSNTCVLSPDLSAKLKEMLNNNLNDWLVKIYGAKDKAIDLSRIEFALHCGGLKLLNTISKHVLAHYNKNNWQDSEKNEKELMRFSWDIYKQNGNQSGCSIFFVLKNACQKTEKNNIFFMAMGPGVTIQVGSLQKINLFHFLAKNFKPFASYFLLLFVVCFFFITK